MISLRKGRRKMPAMNMKSIVTADITQNRLYICLKGTIRGEDIDSIYTDIRFSVADLSPNFDVITDLTDAKIGHLIGLGTFVKISRFLQDRGVNRIIRIAPTQNIIAMQLANVSSILPNYKPVYVDSWQEAQDMLDSQMQKAHA